MKQMVGYTVIFVLLPFYGQTATCKKKIVYTKRMAQKRARSCQSLGLGSCEKQVKNDVEVQNKSSIECGNQSCSDDSEVLKSDSHGTGGGPHDDKKYKSRVIYNSKVNKAMVEASLACKGKRFKPLIDKTVVKSRVFASKNKASCAISESDVLQILSVVQSFPSLNI